MYEGNKVLRLPKGIHFVIPEYVSESLAHNQLQPEKAFLIDLARMATMASDLEVCCDGFLIHLLLIARNTFVLMFADIQVLFIKFAHDTV